MRHILFDVQYEYPEHAYQVAARFIADSLAPSIVREWKDYCNYFGGPDVFGLRFDNVRKYEPHVIQELRHASRNHWTHAGQYLDFFHMLVSVTCLLKSA